MSYKTDRLVDLFPDVYAVRDRESLLYKLLDAIGSELMAADESLKRLLKSHWIDYAEGAGLDGLGAIYGVARRRLRDGSLESDEAFRLRLKSVVALFTGGGTVEAVKRAVRSALGLPLDSGQLNLPSEYGGLGRELDNLVELREFSPKALRFLPRPSDVAEELDGEKVLKFEVDLSTATAAQPEIRWKFTKGSGRRLVLTQRPVDQTEPTGIQSKFKLERERDGELEEALQVKVRDELEDKLIVKAGQTLVLVNGDDGRLTALLEYPPDIQIDVSDHFVNLDGSSPAVLPEIATGKSEWTFRSRGGLFDVSTFDEDCFDLPEFTAEVAAIERQRLSFDVYVPYFVREYVRDLIDRYNYPGDLFVFEGLPPEQIQTVVNQTKAAGVRGNVYFSLHFSEVHNQSEWLTIDGLFQTKEDAGALDALDVGSLNREAESHDIAERFEIGGVFDVSDFDTQYCFL